MTSGRPTQTTYEVYDKRWETAVGPVLKAAIAVGDKVVAAKKSNGQTMLCTYRNRKAAQQALDNMDAPEGAEVVEWVKP